MRDGAALPRRTRGIIEHRLRDERLSSPQGWAPWLGWVWRDLRGGRRDDLEKNVSEMSEVEVWRDFDNKISEDLGGESIKYI